MPLSAAVVVISFPIHIFFNSSADGHLDYLRSLAHTYVNFCRVHLGVSAVAESQPIYAFTFIR